MHKSFENIRDQAESGLRRICGKISPDRRATVVIALLVVFAALNLWMTGKAIWSIGREDGSPRRIGIPPPTIPDSAPQWWQDTENQLEQHLNSQDHDTTTIEQGETER